MSHTNRVHLLALSLVPGIGPQTIKKICAYYPDLELFWNLPTDMLATHLPYDTVNNILHTRKKINPQVEAQKIQQAGVKFLSYIDHNYPKVLQQIYDPPPIIYYQGNVNSLRSNLLAVVGTRKISSYAEQVLPQLLKPVISQGVVVVSGLALGVDGLAHSLAVKQRKPTVAVLGSGVDWQSIYPRAHYQLAKQIVQYGGLLISEYPPLTTPIAENFPRRNRIISGLSKATFVVEAPQRSGALITAYQALEQDRDVLALPGNINLTNSQGTNKLIQCGAKPITSATDILEIFQLDGKYCELSRIYSELDEIQQKIVDLLDDQQLTVDKLQQYSKIPIENLNATLSQLEIEGLIKRTGSGYYFLTTKLNG